jgi:hypothetical protein
MNLSHKKRKRKKRKGFEGHDWPSLDEGQATQSRKRKGSWPRTGKGQGGAM